MTIKYKRLVFFFSILSFYINLTTIFHQIATATTQQVPIQLLRDPSPSALESIIAIVDNSLPLAQQPLHTKLIYTLKAKAKKWFHGRRCNLNALSSSDRVWWRRSTGKVRQ